MLPSLAAQLVQLKVDVIVTAGTPGGLAAKSATTTIPIVLAALGDAVGAGLVSSLAHPGGNVTGLSALSPEVEGKRLQLLKEMLPRLSRVAVLMNPANPVTPLIWKQTQAAAMSARVTVQAVEVRAADAFERAFALITKAKPDAMIVIADRPFLISHRARIVSFAARSRLPAVYTFREFVQEGGLAVYGPNFPDMFRRAATYVDKILKGANPANLPVEQPTKFELVINLKTAKALGLTIPPSLLGRADEVIQ
jgi:putative ABC transport system substrate-binding protein